MPEGHHRHVDAGPQHPVRDAGVPEVLAHHVELERAVVDDLPPGGHEHEHGRPERDVEQNDSEDHRQDAVLCVLEQVLFQDLANAPPALDDRRRVRSDGVSELALAAEQTEGCLGVVGLHQRASSASRRLKKLAISEMPMLNVR